MAAYRRVYDSRHLQAHCQEPGSAPEPSLGNRVWATFFIRLTRVFSYLYIVHLYLSISRSIDGGPALSVPVKFGPAFSIPAFSASPPTVECI